MLRILVLFAGLTAAGPAFAHAQLVRATPAAGATVAAPADVAITFSEAVEPRFSSITVRDAKGERVDVGQPHQLEGDAHRLGVDLKPLPPGTYAVTWHATSIDTHKTQGHFSFTVKP